MTDPSSLPPARPRRRFRLTIGLFMLGLPAVALILVYGLGIDPLRRNPYWDSLDDAKRWCGSGSDDYFGKVDVDWSKKPPVVTSLEPMMVKLPSMVKMMFIKGKFEDKNYGYGNVNNRRYHCCYERESVAQDGRETMERSGPFGKQGGGGGFDAARMLALKKLTAALPRSQYWISSGRTVVVSFLNNGTWTTRTYDVEQLPPEVVALAKELHISFD